jgi:hypothetical protein
MKMECQDDPKNHLVPKSAMEKLIKIKYFIHSLSLVRTFMVVLNRDDATQYIIFPS